MIIANVSLDKEVEHGRAPVIEGDTPLAFALSKATGFGIEGSSERVIRVNDGIEFIDKGYQSDRLNIWNNKWNIKGGKLKTWIQKRILK